MYPIRLKVFGIRDFIPVELDLGGEKDHVLIGGKNGSGKSTLVYAAAFALVSARVSVDGLRSKLRKKDEHWHARVSVLFHNPPGPEKKDAPEYVELCAEVRSRAGTESRQVIYSMAGGETAENLQIIRKFQSRQEAHDYYKRVFNIDTEGYFMFWYQGSITEFANISDAARFERVAEMFGIDRIKVEWDEARAAMEEAEADFNRAKSAAILQEQRLRLFEKNKNELESRDRLRAEGLLLFDACFREISEIYRKELEELSERLAENERSLEEWRKRSDEILKAIRDLEIETEKKQTLLKIAQDDYTVASSEHMELRNRIEGYEEEKRGLEEKVKDVQDRLKRIFRPKEKLQEEKGRLKADLEHLAREIDEMEQKLQRLGEERSRLDREIGRLGGKLDEVNKSIEEYSKLDGQLPKIVQLLGQEEELSQKKKNLALSMLLCSNEIQSLKARLAFLKSQGSPVLLEQAELLKQLRQRNTRAAAFGEIFEAADDNLHERIEELLLPLKHVIFTEHLPRDITVESPFYVVDLGKVIAGMGQESRETQPLGAKAVLDFVKFSEKALELLGDNLLEGVKHWASKILVRDEAGLEPCGGADLSPDLPAIERKMLWDAFGARGPFDKSPAIGKRAYRKAVGSTEQEILGLERNLDVLKKEEKAVDAAIKGVQENIAKRRDVDKNLPLLLEERGRLSNELRYLEKSLEEKSRVVEELTGIAEVKKQERTTAENMLKQVEGELAVYAEAEREQASILRVRELESIIDDCKLKKGQLDVKLNTLQEMMGETRRGLRDMERDLDDMKAKMETAEKRIEILKRERTDLEERRTTVEIEREEKQKEYDTICREYTQVIQQLKNSGMWRPPIMEEREKNRPNLERKFGVARNKLDEARQRVVDEDARRKYEDFLVEYSRAKKEMEESEIRFNILKKKEEEKRAEYDKAVYYRWQRTNQRFSSFMERLHMAGHIVSVPPDEDGKNKDYRWELHVATRMGHKPEKIFPESGRIVGEGISGGERAAVSLVFALALLSDIEDRPPFYVLDEFDSALDEERKHEIFDLYQDVLDRKLIIVSPKVHGDQYLDRFSKFLCVVSNPGLVSNQTVSEVYEVTREGYRQADLEN